MKKILILIFLYFPMMLFSQNQRIIDSLENVLLKAKANNRIEILFDLSKQYCSISSKKALSNANKGLQEAVFSKKPELISKAYVTLGYFYTYSANFDSAMYYYSKALKTSTIAEQTTEIFDNIGVLYKDKSIYDSSLLYLNQSCKLKETLGNQKGVADSYTNIGNVYMLIRDFDNALHYYKKALEIRKSIKDTKLHALVLNNISDVYKNQLQYNKALSYLQKALSIQKEIADNTGIAYTLNGIGNLYFQLKIYDKAQEYYTKALEIRTILNNKNEIAASKFNIGTVHRDIGNFKEALKYYSEALELRKSTGAKEAEALIHNAIGGLYKNKKLYSLAIKNYYLALQIYTKTGSYLHIANTFEKIGIAYKDTANYIKAEHYFTKSLENFKKIKHSTGIARIYNYMGTMYKDKKDFSKSLYYYSLSIPIYDSIHNISAKAYTLRNLGNLYDKSKNSNKAIFYFEQSLQLAEQTNDYSLIESLSYSLYSLYKTQNNVSKSLSYFEKYTAIKDTITRHKNIQRIAELEFESNIKYLEKVNENQELKIKEEKSKQTQITWYLVISIIILLIIIIFWVVLYKQFNLKKIAFNLLTEKSKELEEAYEELESVNVHLHEKNTKITDSLSYAKRIQKTILPKNSDIESIFPKHFIFYVPKEIVSGDFYWLAKHSNYDFFAVVDCTGHGVPGAFMSMVGNTLLNQIVLEQEIIQPSEILQKLDSEIIKILKQNDETTNQEDGMEISLLRIDKINKKILFAGAGHKLLITKGSEIELVQTSHFAIGGMHEIKQDNNITFDEIELSVLPDSYIYLFTDGFIDQFGGNDDGRYTTTRFIKTITSMQHFDIYEQYIQLSKTFDDWIGNNNQTDDVLVVGIKVE